MHRRQLFFSSCPRFFLSGARSPAAAMQGPGRELGTRDGWESLAVASPVRVERRIRPVSWVIMFLMFSFLGAATVVQADEQASEATGEDQPDPVSAKCREPHRVEYRAESFSVDLGVGLWAWPLPMDWDQDGDLDLVVSCPDVPFGGVYFENVGSRSEPRYAAGRRLMAEEDNLHMDLQMIVPVAIDWDRDEDVDLICGDEDGRVAFIENTGKFRDGLPQFHKPKYFQQEPGFVKCGALATPVSVDWDEDGDEDLVCGNSAGYIEFIENLDGGCPPRWASPERLKADGKIIRIQAGRKGSIQGPCEAKWGYTTLSVADWDVASDDESWTFRDEGRIGELRLAGHTTSPTIVDWNRSGKPDLLVGAEDGHLYYQPHNWQHPRRQETKDLVIKTRHTTMGILDNGQQAYGNRDYVWYDVPKQLRGRLFSRTRGGERAVVSVKTKTQTVVYMATARARDNVDLSGWTQVEGLEFGYTDGNRTRMDVFRREADRDDRIVIPQGNWSGGLLLVPPAKP